MALAVGCYHAERVTGVFCLDSGPLDHRHYEAYRELKDVVKFAHGLNLNRGRNDIEVEIKEKVFVSFLLKKNLMKISARSGEKS